MKSFKDLGIENKVSGFVGEKIKMERILNKQIIIKAFKTMPSTQKENTDCLMMQIEFNGEDRVFFTGSKNLLNVIKIVPADAFPFLTTIAKPDGYFEFT